jgi:hypothetical protein
MLYCFCYYLKTIREKDVFLLTKVTLMTILQMSLRRFELKLKIFLFYFLFLNLFKINLLALH